MDKQKKEDLRFAVEVIAITAIIFTIIFIL